jgi:hypothetical protein
MRIQAVIALAALIGAVPFSIAGAQRSRPVGPATSLVHPTSPAGPVDADGFIRRWLLLEPIHGDGQLTDAAVRAAIKTDDAPSQLAVMPRDGDAVTAGGTQLTWHAVETTGYNVNLYHFAFGLGKPTSNVLFWAVTVVNSPRERSGVRLAIGSNAASAWWLNDQDVISLYGDRQTVIDDGVSKRVVLRKGRNVIRAAIINRGGATDFCARFLDEQSRPITGLTVSLD